MGRPGYKGIYSLIAPSHTKAGLLCEIAGQSAQDVAKAYKAHIPAAH